MSPANRRRHRRRKYAAAKSLTRPANAPRRGQWPSGLSMNLTGSAKSSASNYRASTTRGNSAPALTSPVERSDRQINQGARGVDCGKDRERGDRQERKPGTRVGPLRRGQSRIDATIAEIKRRGGDDRQRHGLDVPADRHHQL